MAKTKRFELKASKSQKFWETALSGQTVTVCFGRIGTNGQTKSKDHGSAKDAKAAQAKLIAEKLKKGYVETKSTSRNSTDKKRLPTRKARGTATKDVIAAPDSIRACWKRLHTWLSEHGAQVEPKFPNGAKAAEIKMAEKGMGRTFPKDFNESLRIQCRLGSVIPSARRNTFSDCAYDMEEPSQDLSAWLMLNDLYD